MSTGQVYRERERETDSECVFVGVRVTGVTCVPDLAWLGLDLVMMMWLIKASPFLVTTVTLTLAALD